MIFQDVVRSGAQARAKSIARYRVLCSRGFWSAVVVGLAVAYITACGYVYNLSRERHQLMVQREALRKEYNALWVYREALRNPLRVRKEAKAYGMVLLTEAQAVVSTPKVLAKRD